MIKGCDCLELVEWNEKQYFRKSGKKVFSVQEMSPEEMKYSGFVLALNRHLEKEVIDLLKMKAFTQYICVGKYFMEY